MGTMGTMGPRDPASDKGVPYRFRIRHTNFMQLNQIKTIGNENFFERESFFLQITSNLIL